VQVEIASRDGRLFHHLIHGLVDRRGEGHGCASEARVGWEKSLFFHTGGSRELVQDQEVSNGDILALSLFRGKNCRLERTGTNELWWTKCACFG
jgi:hypothetical protein